IWDGTRQPHGLVHLERCRVPDVPTEHGRAGSARDECRNSRKPDRQLANAEVQHQHRRAARSSFSRCASGSLEEIDQCVYVNVQQFKPTRRQRRGPMFRPGRDNEAHPSPLLAILCAATFMSSLDVFIVNVGLRFIGKDLGSRSLADLSWILTAYAIVFAALLVPAGRLADRYGVKQAFLFGLAVFTLGSLGCALSTALWVIVGMRCLQAVGAAALVPTSLGLILTAIPAERRKHSIQIWAGSGSLGAAAGPALGGLLVQASWRWIFVLNIPIGVIALVAAAILAPNIKYSIERRVPDLWGGLLLIVAIGALPLALVQGSGWGWSSIRILVAFGVSVIGLA